MATSFVYISHCFFSSDETLYRHKALLKSFQAALETAEKQPSSSSAGQSLEDVHGKQRIPLAFVLLWNDWIEKDRSVLTPGWFLWPQWSNSASSSQWKLRVMLFNSPPCVSFGARAVLIQEKQVAITWLYGVIQSWYITHGLEKNSFSPSVWWPPIHEQDTEMCFLCFPATAPQL